jgi:hypothetical protein
MGSRTAHARILLAAGAALGMLLFLVTFGATATGLARLFAVSRATGSGSPMVGVSVAPVGLGLVGLIAFLLCARALRGLRGKGGPGPLR